MQVLLDSEGIDAWDQVQICIQLILLCNNYSYSGMLTADPCLADWTIQHSDFLLGCATVQPFHIQSDGGH